MPRFKFAAYEPTNTGSIAQLMLQSGQLTAQKLEQLAKIAADRETSQGNTAANVAAQGGDRSAALINSISEALGKAVNQTAANVSDADYEPGGKKFSGPMQPGDYDPGGPKWEGPVWQPSQGGAQGPQGPTMADILAAMGARPATPAPAGPSYQQGGFQGRYQAPAAAAQQDALANWRAYFGKG